MAPEPDRLNENHIRRLRISCQHIDRVLGEIENALNESSSKAAFPEYVADISPAQKKTIEDYIARIRSRLIHVLEGQGIGIPAPSIPVTRAIRGRLYTIDIAAEELKPRYMSGFGPVPEKFVSDLNGIAAELQALVVHVEQHLAEGAGRDFRNRLQRLEAQGNDLSLLSRIERVVTDRGLVEFRGAIASILDRAEDRSFEIAVFGRVSSGKSSLLNAILGTDILPVGVTPVTAVPTRIVHGESPLLTVSFTDAPATTFAIGMLAEFATEQKNPKNSRHVTRITVTTPAPRLANGVSFVDTPGLGSLATSGAAETLAYLPKCDLGVVLVDAGSTLTDGDLQIILALQEAAVPAHVLLSKADILDRPDCEKTLTYMKEQIASGTGLDLPVHPVSVRPSHSDLLDTWFSEEILPLYDRSQELRAASLQRKIGSLRESVVHRLKSRVRRDQEPSSCTPEAAGMVDARLRRVSGLVEETQSACEKRAEAIAKSTPMLCSSVAASVMTARSQEDKQEDKDGIGTEEAIRNAVLRGVQADSAEIRTRIEALACQIENELVKSAGDLCIADKPADGEFLSLVREMPVFDTGEIRLNARKSSFAALLGKRYEEEQMARQIRESLEQSLASYTRVMKEWIRRVTSQIGRQFDTYAERYRAQAEQVPHGEGLAPEERQAIEADLRLLETISRPPAAPPNNRHE